MGDGQPEEIYMEFASLLRQKDMLDSFDIYWGSPEIYRAFKDTKDWSLDTIQGEAVVKPILAKTDSSMEVKQISYKEVIGQDTVWCNQTTLVEDTTTHTMVEAAVIDPVTGDTVKYACSYKDKTISANHLVVSWRAKDETLAIRDSSEKRNMVQKFLNLKELTIPVSTMPNGCLVLPLLLQLHSFLW